MAGSELRSAGGGVNWPEMDREHDRQPGKERVDGRGDRELVAADDRLNLASVVPAGNVQPVVRDDHHELHDDEDAEEGFHGLAA